ncbi:MAG: LysR substrate-binding domain-containing protein, partial [Deltaproteobacteria bacterium]|nr:LysR substrate-binding domain-containing protein [Deltaproteobacteria bacterium]
MHLTMRQIALFESVARNLSFTKAARELFLTQPAVSIQIKHLEESVGAPLFEQIGKRIFLTAAGREVFLATQDVLARTKELERTLAEMRGGMVGNLDIAVVSAANYFAPHLLGAFLKLYPGVNVRLQVTNREEVIERLHDNKDDLVIMGQVPDAMVVEAHPFLENPLVLVAPPDHPLAGEKHIPI